MKDFKTKSKIEKVVVHPFFYFEFDHMPSDQEIKEELVRSVKRYRIRLQEHCLFCKGFLSTRIQRQFL